MSGTWRGESALYMLASFFWEGSAFWTFCRLAGEVKMFACGHLPREK